MKKKLLLSLTIIFAAIAAWASAPTVSTPVVQKEQPQGVRLTSKQMEMIRPFHPHLFNGDKRKAISSAPRLSRLAKQVEKVSRVNASGSSLQGWRTVQPLTDANSGWFELNTDGSQELLWEYNDPNWEDDGWSDKPDFPFISAFVRNGKMYGFHSEMIMCWLVWGHGCFTFDGEISDYQLYGEDFSITDFSTYVITCAYVPEKDIVYAYTLNSDATAYQLQTVNPDTWAFEPVRTNIPIEDVLVGMAHNPVDGKIYGLTPDSRFCTLNSDGSLNLLAKFDLPISTQMSGMVYSPLDRLIYFVFADGDNDAVLYSVDPANPSAIMLATLTDVLQYRILVTPDRLVADNAPVAPQIISIDFPNGSLSGTATVKVPATSFGGAALSGEIKMQAMVDGEESSVLSGVPGENVVFNFSNLPEGVRRFSFYAEANNEKGIEASGKRFVGYGIPQAPTDINLNNGQLTWAAVTATTDGGYLDAEQLYYNIYLNGEKINDTPVKGTSYMFTMPDSEYSTYVAQVEAVNHGHISDRGYSNSILHGSPLPLPAEFTPTETQAALFSVSSQMKPQLALAKSWKLYTSDYDPNEKYFFCNTTSYEASYDEWLLSPPMLAPQSDSLIEVSLEVRAPENFNGTEENIAIGYGSEQSREAMTVAKQWLNIPTTGEWIPLKYWIAPKAGTFYLGLLTHTSESGYEIDVRNIKISVSDRKVGVPANLSATTATAYPSGALKASVSFTLPSTAADGSALSDKQLTATIKSDVATATVTGAPGTTVKADIETIQGWNELTLFASNEAGQGLESSLKIFTGMDMPGAIPSLSITNLQDYGTLHLKWEKPTASANGGYFNPDDVTYHLWRYDEDSYDYVLEKTIEGSTECDYTPQAVEAINTVTLAISTENAQGHNTTVLVMPAPYGTPYKLPMTSDFENYELPEPCFSEKIDDSYKDEFGFVLAAYPYFMDIPTPYGNAAYVTKGVAGDKSRIVLPAFSTKEQSSVSLDAPFYTGKGKPTYVIYAESYGIPTEEIERISDEGETAFRRFHIPLPEKFMNRDWVYLKIEAQFNSEEETTAAFGQYCIRSFMPNDFAMTGLSVDPFMYVGKSTTISAVIENNGSASALAPELEVEVASSIGTKTLTLTSDKQASALNVLESATYSTEWKPGVDDMGNLTFTVRPLQPDMDPSNDSLTAKAQVAQGKAPVVTDLKGELQDNSVALTWTDPDVQTGKESFESFADFSYGDKIGDFKTLRLDEYNNSLPFIIDIPYMKEGKAWQVINIDEIDRLCEGIDKENIWFFASSGKKCLLATTPLSMFVGEGLEADRWLITPELHAGSTVKFMLGAGQTGLEIIDVLYSATDDDPESFQTIETLRLLSAGLKQYEYKLPDDAKYFALRYRSNTDEGAFVLLDDFEYEPVEESPVIKGYDIFRSGVMTLERANVFSQYTDTPESLTPGMYYHIIPVISRGGREERGMLSNRADITITGVDMFAADKAAVSGGSRSIIANGLSGTTLEVLNTQGMRIASLSCSSSHCEFPCEPGIYIVKYNGTGVKVLVR